MKTFLTICTCAMVTAGIYGFADMVHDVKNGTMISYDRGETESSVTASMLRSGKRYAIPVNDIRKAPSHFDLKVPVKKEADVATPRFTFTGFTKSFSRAAVEMEYPGPVADAQLLPDSVSARDISSLLSTGTFSADSARTTAIVKKPVKKPVAAAPVAAADSTIAQPVAEAATDVKVDSVPQLDVPKEEFDYRDFSRGSPRKYKKKKL